MRMSTFRSRTVRTVLSCATLGAALLTAACGSSTNTGDGMNPGTMASSGAASAAAFNDADVTFATGMIPHHRQALQMAQLAQTKAVTPAVKDLAARISAAQQPEISTMSGWLTAWGKPVPGASSTPGMNASMPMGGATSSGMPMGGATSSGMPMPGMGGDMPGMMSDQDMTKLNAASGTAFDKMFLTMMVAHHQGAVQMATTERAQGANPAAKKLAESIATSQAAEITEMQGLLGKS